VIPFKRNALQSLILADIEKRQRESKPLMPLTTRIWRGREYTSALLSDSIYREFLKRQLVDRA